MELLGIKVTIEEFDKLMCEQSQGKELKVDCGKIVAVEHTLTETELKQNQIKEIKQRLNELNKDFIQESIGAVIPNIENKKIEFINLHNKLRILEGKEARVYIKKV